MQFIIPPYLAHLATALAERDIPLYAVGGFVRDQILGWPHHDVDVCGPCLPEVLAEVSASLPWLRVIPRDTALGTVELRWQYGNEEYSAEYTTFRTESYPPGGFHRPDRVQLSVSLEEDALRRDFTMNAMYLRLPEGTLIDPLHGRKDARALVIRTTREPDAVFADDGLRLMRLVRFAVTMRASVHKKTWQGACRWVHLLRDIAPERISAELSSILLCDIHYPPREGEVSPVFRALEMLREMGALDIILPELTPCFTVEQDPRYHDFDVGHHLFCTCSRTPPDILLRLAALLHDVGKPTALEQNGRMLFHGELGAPAAESALLRLRYPRALARDVARLVETHMYDLQGNARIKKLRWFFARLGYPMAENWVAIRRADMLGSRARLFPGDPAMHWRDALADMMEEGAIDNPRHLALNGGEIAALMGEKPSPRVGQMKELLWMHAVEFPANNTKEALTRQLGIIRRSHPDFRSPKPE